VSSTLLYRIDIESARRAAAPSRLGDTLTGLLRAGIIRSFEVGPREVIIEADRVVEVLVATSQENVGE